MCYRFTSRPHTIDGRTVQPKRAVPRGDSGNPGVNVTVNKIFIGGIRDKPVSKEDLEMYFGCFGRITVRLYFQVNVSVNNGKIDQRIRLLGREIFYQ